jgi:hypothetical protein
VDRVAVPPGDDVDLDALMLRVRDAARAGTGGEGALPKASGDDVARRLELIRVLEAQGEWNERARQSLVALADGVRALRDDWADAEAELRREMTRLSALVAQLRPVASRKRRGPASKRRGGKARTAGTGRARR